MIDKNLIKKRVKEVKNRFGIDSECFVDLRCITNQIDSLTLASYPLGQNISGMCVKKSKNNVVIGINSGETLGRQRFMLAHELYHLFYGDGQEYICQRENDEDYVECEKEADLFAEMLLVNEETLTSFVTECNLKNRSFEEIKEITIRLSSMFGVAYRAIAVILSKLSHISESTFNNLVKSQNIKSKAETLGIEMKYFNPSPEEERYLVSGKLIRDIEKAYKMEVISTGKYRELLLNTFQFDLAFNV